MGYCPFSVFCCDRDFWVPIATVSVVSRQELVRARHFGSQQGILGRDMVHRLQVAPRLRQGSMSQHSLARVGENLYRDKEFSGHDRASHDRGGQAHTAGAQDTRQRARLGRSVRAQLVRTTTSTTGTLSPTTEQCARPAPSVSHSAHDRHPARATTCTAGTQRE